MKVCALAFGVSLFTACLPVYQPQPPVAPAPGGAPASGARNIRINGQVLSAEELATFERLEAQGGRRVPDGDYWYDAMCGAAGAWGGPTIGFLPAGLRLGGRVPANASGGGGGNLTGVFINGREIHPQDVMALQQLLGPVRPGSYWLDANGNAGMQGGPAIVNLYTAARQRSAQGGGGSGSYWKQNGPNDNTFITNGCGTVRTTMIPGESSSGKIEYSGGNCP